MKFQKQVSKMMNDLRTNGIEADYNGVGFYTSNGYYVETSSFTNIYKENELVKIYKTPKGALNFLIN